MRNECLMTITIVVTIFLFIPESANGALMRRWFARGNAPTGTILRTFAGVSVLKCEEECDRRRKCTGAFYSKRASVCKLIMNVGSGETVRVGRGMVFLSTQSSPPKLLSKCGDEKCKEDETCMVEDICEVTECGHPSYPVVKGNMYAVNNSLLVDDGAVRKKLTCMANGAWLEENIHRENNATSVSQLDLDTCSTKWTFVFGSCYRLSKDLVSWHHAKAGDFLQPVLKNDNGICKICEAFHPRAHLAYIETIEELGRLLATGSLSGQQIFVPWLGGHNEDGQWRWGDGSLVGSWIWSPGRPLNQTGRCLSIHDKKSADDRPCYIGSGVNYRGLCEIEFVTLFREK